MWVTNPVHSHVVIWLLKFYVLAVYVVAVGALVAGVMIYRHFAEDLPNLDAIEKYESLAPGVTRIHAQSGAMIAELAREHRAYARYDDIPQPMVEAFLAVEDRRFFEHGGLDYKGLARALYANYRAGTIAQGGSTITQQVAKGFTSHEQTLARKLREAILSVRMESSISKDRILEIYLNKIFLGHGAYGVATAASRYFGKTLDELTLAEAAMIAGLARAPSAYSPVSHPEAAKARRAVVLQDMVEAGYITEEQRDTATQEPVNLVSKPDVFRVRAPHFAEQARQVVADELGEEAVLVDGLTIETTLELPIQAMADAAVDRAVRKLDRRQGWRGPVANVTDEAGVSALKSALAAEYGPDPVATRDRYRLAIVEEANKFNAWVSLGTARAILPLRGMSWASRYDRNTGENDLRIDDVRKAVEVGDVVWVRRAEDKWQNRPASGNEELGLVEVQLAQTPRIEAALYTFEHDTGYAIAIQGGHDYDRSQFNRAVQSCRQPGSVFKAIYYAYALDTGKWTMGTILDDKPYEPEPGEEWDPKNIHGTLEGKVLLRNAFIYSLNLPSIRLFLRLGANNVVEFARRLGFSTELIADKALSLGASCVRIDELSRAFGTFVREGRSFDVVYVRRATDKTGAVVIDRRHPTDGALDIQGRFDALGRHATDPPKQVVDRRTSYLITRMMRDVVTNGIGRRAQRIGVPAGGKSGTASKHAYTTDTWFVGFTSRYVTAAWMGDDKYERSMGDEDASYTTATPLWTDYMKTVVEGVPHEKLPLARPPLIYSKNVSYTEAGTQQRSAILFFKD